MTPRPIPMLLATAIAIGALAAIPGPAAAQPLIERIESLWRALRGESGDAGIASSNGRIEAEQLAIASKFAGRVAEVLVEEGQTVEAGAVVARMDTAQVEAQLRGAQAQVRRARQAEAAAEATITQRAGELEFARQEYDRTVQLNTSGHATLQALEQKRSLLSTAEAAHRAAIASRDEALAAIEAAEADVAALETQLADAVLTAPRRGRIEYKLVQPGEVIAAGASVATLLDLSDMYMTIFLPAAAAGRIKIGDEARVILDPIPDYVVPATVSFVASEAQFTPRSVETSDEREKLMFRVKLRIEPQLLIKYEAQAKTGVRGVGYVRTDSTAGWPDHLAVKLPQ